MDRLPRSGHLPLGFQRQQLLFGRKSAAESSQCAVPRDYAMTRDYDWNAILPVRRTHCARRLGIADALGQLAVGNRLAVGDLLQLAPDLALEIGAFRSQRQIELRALTREIFS